MKIEVVYNQVRSMETGHAEDILADEDTVITARHIYNGLKTLGHTVSLFEINEETARDLKNLKPDVFFNTAFGIGSTPKSEVDVANLLEKIGRPYTGSDARAILLTTDKTATKDLLLAKNLPTPRSQLFSVGDNLKTDLKFPLIVKPNAEDASLGITELSIVNDESALYRVVRTLQTEYLEPVLVEEYIEGRELNVSVLGNGENVRVLPISEIVFGPSFTNRPKVVNFAAKWKTETIDYEETTGVCPADLDEKTRQEIERIGLEAVKLTGCRDYSRVDMRLDKNGRPFILEVNANPGIGMADGLIRSAKAAGLSYPQLLEQIIQFAVERSKR